MSVNRTFPPFVYFVRQVDGFGPVKIGCSQLPPDRLAALMCWSPYPLQIVATIAGDETVERRFHAMFAESHSHREWFHPTPELERTVAQVLAGTFDVSSLPDPRCVTIKKTKVRFSEDTKRGMSWKHRLRHLEGRGVAIPREVREASFRWSAGRFQHDYDPYNPRDAETVEAFLAHHPRKRAA